MSRTEEILNILRTFIIPRGELNYSNPYELLIAVVLSAQTTDKHVNLITRVLFEKYPNVLELSKANIDDIKQIIKPLGLYENKSKNILNLSKEIVERFNCAIPSSFEDLISLPGVGRKTAQVVLAMGFNIEALPVDTHVERVSKRLGIAKRDASVLEVEMTLKRKIRKNEWIDSHHLLLLFGRYYCKAIKPNCDGCKLKKYCKGI